MNLEKLSTQCLNERKAKILENIAYYESTLVNIKSFLYVQYMKFLINNMRSELHKIDCELLYRQVNLS